MNITMPAENHIKAVKEVWTIGHSVLPYEVFLPLLKRSKITAVIDVRSSPYSSRAPQFNREIISSELRKDGISYFYLGNSLGGRPMERSMFRNGIANYERMAQSPAFEAAIERVVSGAETNRIALMCSEHNPLDCHRCLLVGRELADRRVKVNHILTNGNTITQSEIDRMLLKESQLETDDFFHPLGQRLEQAYRERAEKVAYRIPGPMGRQSGSLE